MEDVSQIPVEAARAEIVATETDPLHPYWNGAHHEHGEAVERLLKLRERVTGADAEGEAASEDTATQEEKTGIPEDQQPNTEGEVTIEEAEAFLQTLPPTPEGNGYDVALVQDLLGVAGDLNTPHDEAKKVIAFAMQFEQGGNPPTDGQGWAALVKELGEEGAKATLKQARHVVKRLPVSLKAYLNQTGIGNSAALVKYVASLGKAPLEAKQAAARIMNDPDSPYWKKEHPQHKEMVQRVGKLMRRAYGSR